MTKRQRALYMRKRIARGRSTARNKVIEARWEEKVNEKGPSYRW